MLWSILITSIPERYHTAQPLLHSLLEKQAVARMPDVELLFLMDNKRRPVGAKRNALLDAARGEYVSFIDDDDMVSDEYIQRIYRQIVRSRKESPPADVICFPQRATIQPSGAIHECTYSIAHYKNREPEARRTLARGNEPNVLLWTGPPAHTMAWRAELVRDISFPETMFGEDVSWVDLACEKAEKEIVITGEPLYFYRYSEEGTSTR